MVIFGLLPAIQAARHDPQDALRADSRGSTSGAGRKHVRSALTVAEVALSVALLIGAGLLIRSFARLQQVSPGFTTSGLMTARVGLPAAAYPTALSRRAFYDRLLTDLRGRPGIEAAAIASGPPLSGDFTGGDVKLPSQTNEEAASTAWRLAGPGYFAALGIPLRGREFSMQDSAGSPPVAIISATIAQRYFPNEDPIGRAIIMRSCGESPHTIVGVAEDVRTFGLEADAGMVFYGSATQYAGWNPMSLVWRSQAPSIDTVRASLRAIDPNVPMSAISAMDSLFENSLGPRRFNLYLLTAFAGVALALPAIGLFGVMATGPPALGSRRPFTRRHPRDVFRQTLQRHSACRRRARRRQPMADARDNRAVLGVGGRTWSPSVAVQSRRCRRAGVLLTARRAMKVDPVVRRVRLVNRRMAKREFMEPLIRP